MIDLFKRVLNTERDIMHVIQSTIETLNAFLVVNVADHMPLY